jgi:hypothetical protein
MWDSYPGGYQGYQNQILLATGGNAYGPQFGPAEPREYEPQMLECGCSEEDCDGFECGHSPYYDMPEDYHFWQGTTPEREAELQYEEGP